MPFNGNIGENAFKHINRFLEVVGPIKINGLTQDQFRLSVFRVSLLGAASEWFTKECIGSITTWDNMVEKFTMKFHHLSDHDKEEETEEDDNPNETDNVPEIFKIEGNLMTPSYDDTRNGNGEHNNSRMITTSELKIGDEFLKILQDNAFNGLDGGYITDHIAKVLEITEWIKMPNVEKNELRIHVFSKSLCGDAKTSKILDDLDNDAQDANDVYEVINREYSPIPIPSRRDIDNPDELCKTKEFTVVRHSIDNDEEFVIVGPSKVSTLERTPSSMSCIYHELFNSKDHGWTITCTK
ncbi:hypothetical protein Tco_0389984 [Tanacetum coccineum]